MGGHAFKSLHCPRMPPETYVQVKSIASAALQKVFTNVTVPLEVPGKADHGDCDFLVSTPFGDSSVLTSDTFPFESVVDAIKQALNTHHGRRGFLAPTCMFFAIPMPLSSTPGYLNEGESSGEEIQFWAQIDIEVCFKPETFSWKTFELNYASQSSILGSMVKPLGLTLDPEGLHVRVKEMESTDWAASMVWITKDPWTVCRILGLSRRAVDGGFKSAEESEYNTKDIVVHMLTRTVYEEYTSSWLFHPEQFKAKLEDDSYLVQHVHRSRFLKKWIPERYPEYKLIQNGADKEELVTWTARTRAVVREKVFTMFPQVAEGYYAKRFQHVNETEERTLRELLTAAIPSDTRGWRDDFSLPTVIIRQPPAIIKEALSTPDLQQTMRSHGELTPPPSPFVKPSDSATDSTLPTIALSDPLKTPLYIDALSRQPPLSYKLAPPPQSMSAAARLACLARWTAFSATGVPYLLTAPHAKDFELQWRDAIAAGCSEGELVQWAQELWWVVWVRQCVVNWRGMWAKRFEKEDAKAEKARKAEVERVEREKQEGEARARAEELDKLRNEKVLGRLKALNQALGLLK